MPAPKFPKLEVPQLTGAMKAFESLVDESKTATGRVSMNKLRDKIDNAQVDTDTKDALWSALDVVERSFPRTASTGGSCGYTYSTAPKRLSEVEVTTVMSALAKAQKTVKKADANADKKLQPSEAAKLLDREDLESQLLGAALDPKLAQYRKDVKIWNATISKLADKKEERASLDNRITFLADYHCQSKLGADAVSWAYRLEAAQGYMDTWAMEEMSQSLKDAESSIMSLVPLTKKDASHENHLSDAEVKAFLGVSDLGAYIEETKAEIENELGQSYDDYLKGKDAPEPPPTPDSGSSSGGC